MPKIKYKTMAVNRPVIIKRGWDGEIEANAMHAYFGEWVVFKLPLSDTAFAELRMPIEEALEQGLVVAADRLEFGPSDYDEDYLDDGE